MPDRHAPDITPLPLQIFVLRLDPENGGAELEYVNQAALSFHATPESAVARLLAEFQAYRSPPDHERRH